MPISKKSVLIITRIRHNGKVAYFLLDKREKIYLPLNEATLRRQIPHFADLSERARSKAFQRFLKASDVIDCGRIPDDLPNRKRPRDRNGHKTNLPPAAYRAGVLDLLSMGQLFPSPNPGFDLLADLLGGLWCRALREVESAYQPVAVIDSRAPEIEACLTAMIRAVVLRHRWHRKRASIRRKAILDFRTDGLQLPPHIQDFTGLKLRVPGKGCKPLRMPYPYQDTAALVIGASSQQLQESAPYLQEAAVFLLSCAGCGDLKGHRIPASVLDSYDPTVLKRLEEGRENTSMVLEAWRRLSHPGLAKTIIQAAKNSFGPPDSRYVSVTLDPRKLNRAIRYQLLLAFLTWTEDCDLLTAEEAATYRAAIKQIYDPEPISETPVRHAEDPEVFLAVMKALVSESDIADMGAPFRDSDKRLGAWRKISGILYLVMPEDGWARVYSRRVRKDKGIDASFFQKTGWEKQLQKILAEQGLIKSTAGTYRKVTAQQGGDPVGSAAAVQQALSAHMEDKDNPHAVDTAQILFTDGESLQYKQENGPLSPGGIRLGTAAISMPFNPASAAYRCIAFGGGKYVALSRYFAAVSETGTDWQMAETGFGDERNAVAYGDGRFIAVCENGAIYKSTDGLTRAPHA